MIIAQTAAIHQQEGAKIVPVAAEIQAIITIVTIFMTVIPNAMTTTVSIHASEQAVRLLKVNSWIFLTVGKIIRANTPIVMNATVCTARVCLNDNGF